ncbi:peptidoglycan-binding protein, partial [bacterium]|nr:peptidoglycan-binding protein [bacterium]
HCHFEVRRYGAKHYVPGSVGAYVTKGAGVPLSFPGLSGETPSSGGGSSSGSSSAYPTIKYGDHGSAVLKAQHLLHDKGYYAGGLDGDFGPITLAATKKFQAHHGLVVDGIIGPHTWAALLK